MLSFFSLIQCCGTFIIKRGVGQALFIYVMMTEISVQSTTSQSDEALTGNLKQCTSLRKATVGYNSPFFIIPTVRTLKKSRQIVSSNHGQVITKAEYGVDLCSDWYFSWENRLKRLMSCTVSTHGSVLAKKLLNWHFHCLSSRGERQRVPSTPQGFWVTVSIGVFKTAEAASNVE